MCAVRTLRRASPSTLTFPNRAVRWRTDRCPEPKRQDGGHGAMGIGWCARWGVVSGGIVKWVGENVKVDECKSGQCLKCNLRIVYAKVSE